MTYYMRSNDAHDDSRYMMHAWGDGKGSWGQHKYIDKRWLNGAWKYLYELPKNVGQAAKNAGQTVKNTAQQAGQKAQQTYTKAKTAVSNTANKAKKAASDFKNYSSNVDSRHNAAEKEVLRREAAIERNDELFNKAAEAQDKATDSAEKQRLQNQINALDAFYERNANDIDKAYEKFDQAGVEKESLKYIASKALNDLLNSADETTKTGAQFIKNLFYKEETPSEEIPEARSVPEKQTGRQYNATSQKAEVKKSEADQKYDDAKTSFDKKYGSGSDFDERDRQITNQLRNLRDRGATDTAVYQRLMDEKNRMWDEANAALAEVNRLDDERRKSGVGGPVASTRDRRSYSNRSK